MINNYSVYEDGTVSFLPAYEAQPSLCTADDPAIIKFELDRLLERDERTGTPGKSHRKLRPYHWQVMPELPVYAADTPSPKLDILITHTERMQRDNAVGSFCGLPIVTLDEFGTEVDRQHETDLLCGESRPYVDSYLSPEDKGYGKLLMSTHDSIPAEILPGEERCADGIIRRVTTAESVGYDAFKDGRPVEVNMGQRDCKASSIPQSTAEDMCAWLNAQPKSSFKSEVVIEGEDKVLRTTDAKGTLLCAFRYVGGSSSHVVKCFDGDNGFHYEPTEPKEYADEWVSNYSPMSHVERITVGGTALFTPEEQP